MIFGDPYRFAILVEYIPYWSDSSFKNGLFHFYINGKMFPDELTTATLNVDVFSLDNRNALVSFPENKDVFDKEIKEAFNTMLGMISPNLVDSNSDIPENFESSYIYKASTENIDDFGSSVFAVSYNDIVRIIGAKRRILRYDNNGRGYWEDIPNPNFYEIKLHRNEVKEIIANIKKYYTSL
ncbi:immunity 42 family protein [Photorhabdus tasmaniensis]|uniref:immunity 42 family protein n=1 Tax=Photorhabdus TaxID=29487 RepID=UPI0036DDD698